MACINPDILSLNLVLSRPNAFTALSEPQCSMCLLACQALMYFALVY